ncbi:MAG: formate dehydrogenase accessory sulfurtransferase FdhD [Ruminococcus sp.]|jgi:FdhD protein
MNEDYMREIPAVRIQGKNRETVQKPLLREQQIVLYVNGRKEGSFSCTPELFREMVLGYLYSEGKIGCFEDIDSLEIKDGRANAVCSSKGRVKEERKNRCVFDAETVQECIRTFFQRSCRHRKTHASHKAMLFVGGADHYLEADDVSRRAAVEKVIGLGLEKGAAFEECSLMFSGRVPKDILLKIKNAGIPLLIGRSYPTWEAVEEAGKCGVILCGNAWEDSFVVYAGTL